MQDFLLCEKVVMPTDKANAGTVVRFTVVNTAPMF